MYTCQFFRQYSNTLLLECKKSFRWHHQPLRRYADSSSDTSRLYIAVRNASRSISDVLPFERGLIVDPHIALSAFSDLTGPLSPAEVTVYICWNAELIIKFAGNPEVWDSPTARLHIVTPKEGRLYSYTDIPPVLRIKNWGKQRNVLHWNVGRRICTEFFI
jgi:hypothetical protein